MIFHLIVVELVKCWRVSLWQCSAVQRSVRKCVKSSSYRWPAPRCPWSRFLLGPPHAPRSGTLPRQLYSLAGSAGCCWEAPEVCLQEDTQTQTSQLCETVLQLLGSSKWLLVCCCGIARVFWVFAKMLLCSCYCVLIVCVAMQSWSSSWLLVCCYVVEWFSLFVCWHACF